MSSSKEDNRPLDEEKSGYHGLITYRNIVDWRPTIMAKTQEELKVIKEEVETLNNKLKELTDKELEQVSGGLKLDPERLRRKVEEVYPT